MGPRGVMCIHTRAQQPTQLGEVTHVLTERYMYCIFVQPHLTFLEPSFGTFAEETVKRGPLPSV